MKKTLFCNENLTCLYILGACDAGSRCFRESRCYNMGPDGSSFECDKCPLGYEQHGSTCKNIDEVSF